MNYELLKYLNQRGIYSPEILRLPQLGEMYQHGFPHIAWANNSGGLELRNANFKGCFGHKDLTICSNVYSNHTFILEGFFDCLTLFEMWLIYYQERTNTRATYFPNVICLNSTTMAARAVSLLNNCPFITKASFILDSDNASKEAFNTIKKGCLTCSVSSVAVSRFKDLNALWTSTTRERAVIIDAFINTIFCDLL